MKYRIVTLVEHTSLAELERIARSSDLASIRENALGWARTWKVYRGSQRTGPLVTNDKPTVDFCGWVYSSVSRHYEWWNNGTIERRRFDCYALRDGELCRCPGDLHRSFGVSCVSDEVSDGIVRAMHAIHANPRFTSPPPPPAPGAAFVVLTDDEAIEVLGRANTTAESSSHLYERLRREGIAIAERKV